MSRSFYVGTAVTVEDMAAKFENGIFGYHGSQGAQKGAAS